MRSEIAIPTGFALIALAAIAAIAIASSTARAERSTAHTLEVRQVAATLFSTIQDAETGQRGYLLTGDLTYLDPFARAHVRLPALKTSLLQMIADSPEQQARVGQLSSDLDRKLAELDRTVAERRAGRDASALAIVKTDKGRNLMNRIRVTYADFDNAELKLLQNRQASAGRLRTLLIALIVMALLVAALLAYLVTVAARHYAAEITAQNKTLINEQETRAQAEAMLRQAQKMEALGHLTGGVAHDFNNMLAIIVGSMDIMLRRLPESDLRLRGLAENALSGANRAAALTKRLLAFSRLQPLDPQPVDVNKCVSDMSELLRRSLGEHIAIETVLGGGVWRAFIDCPQLESALLNLAVNARDAMGERGRLTIETSNAALDKAYAAQHADVEAGQYVLIAVTDTGSGMSPETLSKAFDPFFTTKGVGEGTGLGLSQVHGFIKQSRGHIKLYSEIGMGTTVKLYLPRDTSTGPIGNTTVCSGSQVASSCRTLLVVEDDPGVRSFVTNAAQELGHTVVEADSAVVAMERLEAVPEISILLTDVVMPVMTGKQLVDMALVKWPNLQVIYMTGYTRNAIVHNDVLDPGTRLLTKPFTLEELDRELREVMAEDSLSKI